MLTPAEVIEVRRQAGYPAVAPVTEIALAEALAGLSPEAEAVLRVSFLPGLARLELAVLGASETLDTAKAAVWERNPAEVAERMGLYRSLRIALCRFLGVDPGPGIYDMIVPGTGTGTGTGGDTGTQPGGLSYTPAVLVL